MPPVSAAIAGPPAPSPPKNTLPIERFIASAICLVRIEPEAPTSMPATISAVLSSAMPAAAALRPVNAFRVEMTTGMSAPPIGSTASTPSAPAASRISQNSSCDSAPAAITTASPTAISGERRVDRARDREAALERLLELEERDDRAPERDRADDRGEQDRDQRLELRVAAGLERLLVLDDRDQRDRAAADAVEQRDHLRHRGHVHACARWGRRSRCRSRARRRSGPSRRSAGRSASRRPRSPCRRRRPGCRGRPCAARAACAGPTMNIEKATM